MPPAPGHEANRLSVYCLGSNTNGTVELKVEPAHEAAGAVGLIELLAPQAERWPAVPVHRLFHIAANVPAGVEHQVLADEPAGIREPIGKAARGRVQQQPWRADPVAGHDDDLGRLELRDTVCVVINNARRHTVFASGDLAHATVGAQF